MLLNKPAASIFRLGVILTLVATGCTGSAPESANEWLSDKIRPLHLSDQEVQDVVAFLHALDGEIPNRVSEPSSLP